MKNGCKHSEETKKKISQSCKEKAKEIRSRGPQTEETRKKIAQAHRGKVQSEETKTKIREAVMKKKIEKMGYDYREEDDDYYDEY